MIVIAITVCYDDEADTFVGKYLIDGSVYAISQGNSSAEAREAALSARRHLRPWQNWKS